MKKQLSSSSALFWAFKVIALVIAIGYSAPAFAQVATLPPGFADATPAPTPAAATPTPAATPATQPTPAPAAGPTVNDINTLKSAVATMEGQRDAARKLAEERQSTINTLQQAVKTNSDSRIMQLIMGVLLGAVLATMVCYFLWKRGGHGHHEETSTSVTGGGAAGGGHTHAAGTTTPAAATAATTTTATPPAGTAPAATAPAATGGTTTAMIAFLLMSSASLLYGSTASAQTITAVKPLEVAAGATTNIKVTCSAACAPSSVVFTEGITAENIKAVDANSFTFDAKVSPVKTYGPARWGMSVGSANIAAPIEMSLKVIDGALNARIEAIVAARLRNVATADRTARADIAALRKELNGYATTASVNESVGVATMKTAEQMAIVTEQARLDRERVNTLSGAIENIGLRQDAQDGMMTQIVQSQITTIDAVAEVGKKSIPDAKGKKPAHPTRVKLMNERAALDIIAQALTAAKAQREKQ